MASNKRKRKRLVAHLGGPCLFCDQPATTIDHVPPQGLFARPRVGLIEVPACKQCNGATSKDDEFMQRLALAWGAEQSRDAVAAGAAVLRSIEYPAARGLRRSLLKTLSRVDLWLPAPTATGFLWAGQSLKIQIDGERLERILKKVVRGLYFHVAGKRLPVEYGVHVHPVGKGPADTNLRANELQMLDLEPTVIGDQGFTFRGALCADDTNLSVWRMGFYGVVEYMGYTFRNVGTHRFIMLMKDATTAEVEAAAPTDGQPKLLGHGSTTRVMSYVPGARPPSGKAPA